MLNDGGIETWVLQMPELENYLIDEIALAQLSGAPPELIAERLDEVRQALRESSRSEHSAAWLRSSTTHESHEVLSAAQQQFDRTWESPDGRRGLVRGTRVLADLNLWLEQAGYQAVSAHGLASSIGLDSLAKELGDVLLTLNDRAVARTPG